MKLILFIISMFLTSPGWSTEPALQELFDAPGLVINNISQTQSSVNPSSGQMPNNLELGSNSKIEINIPARKLKVYHQDVLVYEFSIAVGSPGFKTPTGSRSLSQIVWNPWWMPPDSPWAKDEKPTPPGPKNPLGPVKMNLGGAILVHGTNNPHSIGRAASHGCMRLRNEDAQTLAWWIQTNHTDKIDPSLYALYKEKRGRSFYVNLPQSIPVEIKYELFERSGDQVFLHPDVYGRVPNKKNKIKEWLLTQGMDSSQISEKKIDEVFSRLKRESLPLAMTDFISPTDPISVANDSGASAQESGSAVLSIN